MRGRRLPSLLFLLAVASAFLLASPPPARGTEEYAARTGKECGACHLDPSGGGELTAEGKAFSASPAAGGDAGAPGRGSAAAIVRFLAGYVHLVTAVLWFGTILYVHLVLKPAYASGGLPRGEVRVGLASMAVMAVTGAVLAFYRIPSADALLHTRFGLLLVVKVSLFAVMAAGALFVVLAIGPRLRKGVGTAPLPGRGSVLSPEELAACDGADGRPAWFAFEGKVYDAGGSPLWKGGSHASRHRAGEDLTAALARAPHGADRIFRLPEAGTFDGARRPPRPLHVRVFYFMAYFNLVLVFAILLVVALWRWGPTG